MKALRIHARGGPADLVYESVAAPDPGTGDVLVEVHAASYTPGELQWPSTWIDRSGHDRTPIIPCHEFSGVVSSLGFGATGVSVGDEVYGMADWYRDGAAAELVAVEARNIALRPRRVDHTAAATLPLAGLTAWQALFRHGALMDTDTLLVLGAGGGVGSLAVQLAHQAGASVLAAGRGNDRETAMNAGASTYVDLPHEPLPNLDEISLLLDTIGGPGLQAVAGLLNEQCRLVSIVDPAVADFLGAQRTFFVVEPNRDALNEIAMRVDDGLLRPVTGPSSALADGRELIQAKETGRISGKVSLVVR